jgi:primary-amine oxidase
MSRRSITRLLPGVAAAALATASAAAHPLDGLSPAEITAVVEILKADGKADPDSRYSLIELKEPPKADVLAWKAGDPEDR